MKFLKLASSLIRCVTNELPTALRKKGVCVFSVASKNTTQKSGSSKTSRLIGNLSPSSSRVDRQKTCLYFRSTIIAPLERPGSAYSPLKSIRKNSALCLNRRLFLYFSNSSRYSLASV